MGCESASRSTSCNAQSPSPRQYTQNAHTHTRARTHARTHILTLLPKLAGGRQRTCWLNIHDFTCVCGLGQLLQEGRHLAHVDRIPVPYYRCTCKHHTSKPSHTIAPPTHTHTKKGLTQCVTVLLLGVRAILIGSTHGEINGNAWWGGEGLSAGSFDQCIETDERRACQRTTRTQ